ncbi:MAG: AMP-binding protein, partial [SAR324 cluster bacterium]|nr:AMP-binding protein [SAR324 cluster bacterium]
AELLSWLDERFAINDVEMTEVATVASVARIASGHISKRQISDTFIVPQQWFENLTRRPVPSVTEAVSIQEAFLKVAERMGDFVAVADERSGVLSWKRTKLAVLLLANEFRKVPQTHIGVLLPASVGASLVIMAVLFSGKIPVMLNWTAGRRNVEHAIKTCKLAQIISSEAFLDLIDIDLEYIEDKLLLVEKVKANIGLFSKLKALSLASKKTQKILSRLNLDKVKQEDHAVVLFTSGSEADPKGVPLSHRNILSNVDGGFSHFHFDVKDVMYGFLPPFHSFGLTVCCFLPLTTGLRVVYHPNPNESRKLAAGCEKWGITIMAGTPTFLRGILRAGEKEQFKSLRILVAGAEKAPDSLFELVTSMTNDAQLVEGYGITECSPVVCGNRPYQPHAGIGYPLKNVEMMIVHHETFEPLPEGERGLILIRGDNVFSGYLGNVKSPFVEVNGKQWYNSGDLGFVKKGAFHIAGRLKRFVKIGGEMLSLTAVEEALSNEWPGTIEEGPVLAVTSLEKEDGSRPELYLFAKKEIELEKANAVLVKAGFPNLVKISRVHLLNEIPLLGSGKTDIQALNRLVKEAG